MSTERNVDQMRTFLEHGYWQRPNDFHGVHMPCWADDDVTVDSSLRNPFIKREHVDAFYSSFVSQRNSQSIAGKLA
eukprot:3028504-Karenia_brevis.AAC.1